MSLWTSIGMDTPEHNPVKTKIKSEKNEKILDADTICSYCDIEFGYNSGPGRIPQYCKPAHRVAAFKKRKRDQAHARSTDHQRVEKNGLMIDITIGGQTLTVTKFQAKDIATKLSFFHRE